MPQELRKEELSIELDFKWVKATTFCLRIECKYCDFSSVVCHVKARSITFFFLMGFAAEVTLLVLSRLYFFGRSPLLLEKKNVRTLSFLFFVKCFRMSLLPFLASKFLSNSSFLGKLPLSLLFFFRFLADSA